MVDDGWTLVTWRKGGTWCEAILITASPRGINMPANIDVYSTQCFKSVCASLELIVRVFSSVIWNVTQFLCDIKERKHSTNRPILELFQNGFFMNFSGLWIMFFIKYEKQNWKLWKIHKKRPRLLFFMGL